MCDGMVGPMSNLSHQRRPLQEARRGPSKDKREPVTALFLSILLRVSLVAVGAGVASLVTQHQHYSCLCEAIELDIERLEYFIFHIQESLTSLAEVMHNRRGLDLIFLQQGRLCPGLSEECCFYIDHSGVVRESMVKIKEGLAKCKGDCEANQRWFESWFNSSPWLTNLVSILLGPLLIIIMLLTLQPCILSKLVQFIKGKLGAIQLKVIWAQYKPQNRETRKARELERVP